MARAPWLAMAAVMMIAQGARGQPEDLPDEDLDNLDDLDDLEDFTGEIPPGYAAVEIVDVTAGTRDDYFSVLNFDADGNAWLGTFQGRAYRSRNNGQIWDETTVLPEIKPIFAHPNQVILLGQVRSDGKEARPPLDFNFGRSLPRMNRFSHLALERFVYDNTAIVGGDGPDRSVLPIPGPLVYPRPDAPPVYPGSSVDRSGMPRTRPGRAMGNFSPFGSVATSPLGGEADRAVQDPGVVLGAALSARAPRLSLLLLLRGRAIANISLGRLLITTGRRDPLIRRIASDPDDAKRLFASTHYGLYQSFDGGASWLRAFPGLTSVERFISEVLFDPSDSNRAYMGTSRGLFISDDRGESWRKSPVVPELDIRKVIVDPVDPRYIYVATNFGVYRSDDRGATFALGFFDSLPLRRDVQWMVLDPQDPQRAYLGTRDGIMTTDQVRTITSTGWELLAGLRTVNLVVPTIDVCSRHRGHIYAMTRADLPTINYGANGPESYMLESWDGGKSWRVLLGNLTQGDIKWFALDPRDPDTVWVVLARAVVRLERRRGPGVRDDREGPVLPDEPSMSEILLAALEYHGLEMGMYQKQLDRLRRSHILPQRLDLTFKMGRFRAGADRDDLQFADDRYLFATRADEWRLMAFATWQLPQLVYRSDTVPMLKIRERTMNDEVRHRIIQTVHRHYGELQRLKIRKLTSLDDDLETRVIREMRIEMLEAVVDLASGGYLSDYRLKMGRNQP